MFHVHIPKANHFCYAQTPSSKRRLLHSDDAVAHGAALEFGHPLSIIMEAKVDWRRAVCHVSAALSRAVNSLVRLLYG